MSVESQAVSTQRSALSPSEFGNMLGVFASIVQLLPN
jgi:hypothetical protein